MTLPAARASPSSLIASAPSLGAMGVAMISVQVGASLAKGLFPIVGALGATALRVAFAALILAVVIRPWRGGAVKGAWPVVIAYGLSLGLMNLLFYSALRTIPLGVAVAVEFAGPLTVAVIGSRRWIDILWIVLAAAGLVFLLPIWRQTHRLDLGGIALALAAGVCWGLYITFGQKAGAAYGPRAVSIGMGIAALVAVPVGVLHAGASLLSLPVMATAMGVAVLSSALPYSLEMFALTRIPVRVFGTLMSVEPAVAALMGLIILHERLTLGQWLAMAAIMAASLGAALTMSGDNAAAPVDG